MFEIEVNDRECKTDYVICNISFQGNSIVAQRGAVSTKEMDSKFITNSKMAVDSAFSLDEHLQALHGMVLEDINNGDLFSIN